MDHLKDLRVVDVSQNLAGPYCTQILADLGADVTKVEPPAGDAARAWAPPLWGGRSPMFLSVNRGKRSIQINLKSEGGKDILWRLIDDAVESVYRAPEQGPASLAPQDAAEILLVARWFELRPKELKRTATPKKWLAEGGIRPSRRRVRTVGDSAKVSAKAVGGE